ncbi:MAG: alpha/beta hydrolase [Gemmataceae bacterium]|nr:alpha/beta hydrolase [Gemmataceae bacterium]
MSAFLLALALAAPAAQVRTRDVIYGRKFGMALTMDVFQPKKPNGKGVVLVVSGGWFSSAEAIQPAIAGPFLARGYTVFAVVHGSQPKFTLTEIIDDLHRAVRFIRHNAKKWAIDPERIGITGGSAGGHLSLMMGTAGKPGDPKAADPVDRESSAVQAVGAFCPPCDFLNWKKEGDVKVDREMRVPFTAAVDYHEFDPKKAMYFRVTDKEKLKRIGKDVSPYWHVKKGSAPALILHGDKDDLVPYFQATRMLARLKEAGVPCKLETREGAGHVWATFFLDLVLITDWFDEHLLGKKGE